MTYEENIKAILESNFSGFKEYIVCNACEEILELASSSHMRAVDQINQDSYDKGFKDGHEKGYKERTIEEEFDEDTDKAIADAYSKGLDDAWKCAGRIYDMSPSEINVLFSNSSCDNPLLDYSAFEAMDKMKEYDKRIEVGDEVIYASEKYIVTAIANDGHTFMFLSSDGGDLRRVSSDLFEKTGNHYSQIEEVLRSGAWNS